MELLGRAWSLILKEVALTLQWEQIHMRCFWSFSFFLWLPYLWTVPTAKHVSSVPNKEGRNQGTMSSSSSLSFQSTDVVHCLEHMQLFKPHLKVTHEVFQDGSLFYFVWVSFSQTIVICVSLPVQSEQSHAQFFWKLPFFFFAGSVPAHCKQYILLNKCHL